MSNQPLMTAADVMSHDVATVHPETSLLVAVKLMAQRHISGMPVLDEAGHVVGMITEGDLLRWHEGFNDRQMRWLDMLAEGTELAQTFLTAVTLEHHKVKVAMAHKFISVAEDTPLKDVTAIMTEHDIKRVPVVRDGRLVGIVARSDLVRALARLLTQQASAAN